MPQKAALPPAYSASSNPFVLARQARAEAARDWLSALDQKRLALYGAGVAALTAYASLLSLANPAAVSAWAMAAVFVAALTSSIAGFAFSAICGAMLFHLLDDPVQVVEIMMICSIAGQALMVWSLPS
jgi:hypothetical protein